MKKNILTTLTLALLCAGVNAQIGGGILNKAKAKANKAVDNATTPGSGGSNSTPASTGNGSSKPSSSTKTEDNKPAPKDNNIPTKDLKKVIGDNDLYYSALLAQGVDSKIMVPKPVKEKSMQEQWVPNAINFYEDPAKGKIQYCYFALYDGMSSPLSSFKIKTAEDAFRYKYKGIFWDSKSDYQVFENMMYNRWGSSYSSYYKHFTGIVKQADGSIITFALPAKADAPTKDYDEYVSYMELGYKPVANNYDFDNIEVEILTKTEAAAKTADLEAAKSIVVAQVKKILEGIDAKEKLDADKKIAAKTRSKRGMVNAGYEKTMLSWVQANYKKEFRKPEYWENATLGNLIITSTDWNIKKNDYGLILYRSIACEVVIKNKGRCYVRSFVFAQDYAGGGSYSSNLYYNGFSSDTEQLKCDKAN